MTPLDRQRLLEALTLAEGAIGLSDPNPRVGCIIGFADGRVAGAGHTQRAGEAHAEVMALREARSAGVDVQGATAWVTLEPCAHHGRTPPCCDALQQAGISRVVYAVDDPNPQVSGAGAARLRAAGVDVVAADADITDAARELNIGFFSRMQRGRPWVRLKVAASLDGVTALHNGASQWITGDAARADGHVWRRRAGAVLTGIGTVLADDPRLDVRVVPTQLQPMRVVVDSQLRTPPQAALLRPPGRAVIATCISAPSGSCLEDAGVRIVRLAGHGQGVDLAGLMEWLGTEAINELHVEAGPTLNASLLRGHWVDEMLIYLAPRLLGPGARPMAALGRIDSLGDGIQLSLAGVVQIGEDLRITARIGSSALPGT